MISQIFSDCWFLTGATASGKSELGLHLAELLKAEIISLDSMALYRGMDIGTAKPTIAEQARVPHHLLDVIDPHDEFSVAQYLEAAAKCVQEIQQRNRQALFVGGTPLYLKALLRGLFEGPTADWELRKQWEAEAQEQPPDYLHEQLRKVDPIAAARLHPNDSRRIIRALEVYAKTGQPISHWQQQFDRARPASACRVFVLERSREESLARIDARVLTMFEQGLVEEVRQLLALPQPLSRTASQAVGYRETLLHLTSGVTLADTITAVQNSTHRFARRQRTWFRSLSECRSLPVSGKLDAPTLAQYIATTGQIITPFSA